MRQGFQVRLVGALKLPVVIEDAQLAVYMLPAPRGGIQSWGVTLNKGGVVDTRIPVELLEILPAGVLALGMFAGAPFAVWSEREGEEALPVLRDALGRLQASTKA